MGGGRGLPIRFDWRAAEPLPEGGPCWMIGCFSSWPNGFLTGRRSRRRRRRFDQPSFWRALPGGPLWGGRGPPIPKAAAKMSSAFGPGWTLGKPGRLGPGGGPRGSSAPGPEDPRWGPAEGGGARVLGVGLFVSLPGASDPLGIPDLLLPDPGASGGAAVGSGPQRGPRAGPGPGVQGCRGVGNPDRGRDPGVPTLPSFGIGTGNGLLSPYDRANR